MTRSAGFAIENNFSKGLITEATGLNFPENAVTETENCVFDDNGAVTRRRGFELEADAVNISVPLDDRAYTEYLWESVSGNGNLSFHVQQIGTQIRFYRVTGGPTLSNQFVGSIDLVFLSPLDATKLPISHCQFASGMGRLIVTHPYLNPFYLEYSEALGTFSATSITIQIRDFEGVQPRPFESRLSTISAEHQYNLLNQGWTINRQSEMLGKAGFYPNDYEVWWLYKTPDALGNEVFLTQQAIAGGILGYIDRGNSPAPLGSVILNAFYQDRGAQSNTALPVVTSGTNRPSTVEFHAGRAFYAGTNAQDFNGKIYFSQILENPSFLGRCYQANDPTSQFSSDLLPTDGGVISIPEAGTVYKLWSVDSNLLVFASQGVWAITGSQGIGFSAVDYTVKKLSSVTTLSGLSFVRVDGMPLWWSLDDIYAVIPDSTGGLSIKSITSDSIKSLFQAIPEESKINAKGAFSNRDRVIQWVFRDTVSSVSAEKQNYNRILNYNVKSTAFYEWSLDNPLVTFKGVAVLKGQGSADSEVDVVDELGDVVLDDLGNEVFVTETTFFTLSSQFKYVVIHAGTQVTFAETVEALNDWANLAGGPLTYDSYFITGYRVRGDASKKFQANYLRVFVDGDFVQDFYVSALWDYARSGDTGRWSSRQRLEFDDTSYGYLSRRLKIRGNGIALQFKVQSNADADFNLIGWSAFETGNTQL